MSALEKFLNTLPKVYKAETNTVINALITALAHSDDAILTEVENLKQQLFVKTATGKNLDILANGLGVSRPTGLGLGDDKFQQLIPNLSLKPKQIKKAFYDVAEVFWGPSFTRANITSNNAAPFNVSVGEVFVVNIDGVRKEVRVLTGEIAVNGAATAEELVIILNRIDGLTATVQTDAQTGNSEINIRTDTIGPVGSIEVSTESTMVALAKLDFDFVKREVLDLDQRFAVYNINPNELVIEIPAVIPVQVNTLAGSHHFHEDSALETEISPANGIWQGSFLYNTTGSIRDFNVTAKSAVTTQTLDVGEVYTSLNVDDTSELEPSGLLIFSYGLDGEEASVPYVGIANSTTLLLDPSYAFKKNHAVGETVRFMTAGACIPDSVGGDLPVYFTSTSQGRSIIETLLNTLKAAGIVIRFVVLAPQYVYLIDNPFTDD